MRLRRIIRNSRSRCWLGSDTQSIFQGRSGTIRQSQCRQKPNTNDYGCEHDRKDRLPIFGCRNIDVSLNDEKFRTLEGVPCRRLAVRPQFGSAIGLLRVHIGGAVHVRSIVSPVAAREPFSSANARQDQQAGDGCDEQPENQPNPGLSMIQHSVVVAIATSGSVRSSDLSWRSRRKACGKEFSKRWLNWNVVELGGKIGFVLRPV